jgi:hypothetical protein
MQEESLFDIPGLFKLDDEPSERPEGTTTPTHRPGQVSNGHSVGTKPPVLPSLKTYLRRWFPIRKTRRATEKYQPFKVDDKQPSDTSRHFSEISVAVPDAENGSFLLELFAPPEDDQVRYLILGKGGQRTIEGGRVVVRLALTVKDHPWLRKLAKAIGRVVSYRHVRKNRKPYGIRDWKFVAPRTKEALIQLANALREYRGQVAAAKHRK